jgi:hypothetical protein
MCVCVRIYIGCKQCPPYTPVDFGSVGPLGPVGAGDSVQITCNAGYRLKLFPGGDDTPMCKYNMQYTPGAECIGMCQSMAAPPHGYLEPAEDVETFQWVTLGCDKGYKPVGNRYVMCKTDSTYLFEHGACVPTCPLYPQVEHGTVNRKCNQAYSGKTGACADTEYLAGDMADVQCDQTYVLSFESSTTATCGEGGEFDHDVAVCVAMCPAHPPVPHGKLSVTGPTVQGDEVQITCDEGYALENPSMASVVCMAERGASCEARACEEYAPGKADGDCCALPSEAYCAPGFIYSQGEYGCGRGLKHGAVTTCCTPQHAYSQPWLTEAPTTSVAHFEWGGGLMSTPYLINFPPTSSIPKECKNLGYPGSPEGKDKPLDSAGCCRLYSQMDCESGMGGISYPNGECLKTGGGSWSYDCRGLNADGGKHTGEYSRCTAICPPYPNVDFSTITVDGSADGVGEPVREGSVVVVTCDKGYEPGPYNGGPSTAKCVDGGNGGVYDPPMCSPKGGAKGYDGPTRYTLSKVLYIVTFV